MKKLLFVAFVFGGLALTSCKKDYVCTTTIPEVIPGMGETVSEAPFNDLNKSDAEDAETTCESTGFGVWSEK
jgi:hypothetical protein